MVTKEQFAEQIKVKYPQYKDVDSLVLADKILEKYPQYKSSVIQENKTPISQVDTSTVSPEMKTATEQTKKIPFLKDKTPEELANVKMSSNPYEVGMDIGKSTLNSVAEQTGNIIGGAGDVIDYAGRKIAGSIVGKEIEPQKDNNIRDAVYGLGDTVRNQEIMKSEVLPQGVSDFLGTLVSYGIPSSVIQKAAYATKFPALINMIGQAGYAGATAKPENRVGSAVTAGLLTGALEGVKKIAAPIKKSIAGIDKVTELELKGSTPVSQKVSTLDDIISTTKESNVNARVPSAMGRFEDKAGSALKIIKKQLSKAGEALGEELKTVGKNVIKSDKLDNIYNAFKNSLKKFNITIDKNGMIKNLPGREARITSDEALQEMQKVVDYMNRLQRDPTVYRATDISRNLAETINFDKMPKGEAGIINNMLTTVRKAIREGADDAGGKAFANANKLVSESYDTFDTINQSFGKDGARVDLLMQRLFGARSKESLKVFNTIKDKTGIDLIQDASFTKWAIENVGNQKQQELLAKVIGDAIGSSKIKTITNFIKGISSKIVKPENVAMDIAKTGKVSSTLFDNLIKGVPGLISSVTPKKRK